MTKDKNFHVLCSLVKVGDLCVTLSSILLGQSTAILSLCNAQMQSHEIRNFHFRLTRNRHTERGKTYFS